MKIDIMGSMVLTLLLIFISNYFSLGFLSVIFLALCIFLVLAYKNVIRMYFYNFINRFRKRVEVKKAKSSYDDLRVNDR